MHTAAKLQFEELGKDHREEFMRRVFWALGFNGIRGDYVEFGSHGGSTFAMAWGEIGHWPQQRKLWSFDSFQGLPAQHGAKDFHPGWKQGKMATSRDRFEALCAEHGIPADAYAIVEGFYGDTLDGAAPDDPSLPTDIALAYVDCDMYSSTVSVLRFLEPRLKHGMVIAFDDYFAFSDRTLSGNRQAMLEIFGGDHPFHLLPYIQFGWHGQSFVVEDRSLL